MISVRTTFLAMNFPLGNGINDYIVLWFSLVTGTGLHSALFSLQKSQMTTVKICKFGLL